MKIAFSETSQYQLKHPITDEPLVNAKGEPMLVEIYGKHTASYKNAINRLLREEQKRGNKKSLSTEEMQKRGLDLLESCVAGFKNLDIETENGKLDPKDVRGILENVFWIREQIDLAVVDIENFSL